ncbi:30123_t:CDS:2, partial [Gigaspora margarita]
FSPKEKTKEKMDLLQEAIVAQQDFIGRLKEQEEVIVVNKKKIKTIYEVKGSENQQSKQNTLPIKNNILEMEITTDQHRLIQQVYEKGKIADLDNKIDVDQPNIDSMNQIGP